MINFGHLRYFWAVAHDGNLTRAAQALNVSQSAVSVQIQQLEEALGQTLFERRGRTLVLTAAGRIALDHADAIFGAGERLVQSLRRGAAASRQQLRVGAVATLSRNFQYSFLAPALSRPDVGVVLHSGTLGALLRLLETLRLDVLLANTAPPREPGTPWTPHLIAEQPVHLVGHHRRVAKGRDWKARLAAAPLVVPTPETSIRAGFDALMDRLGLTPQIAAEVDDMAMLRLLATNDVGLAVVPAIVVRDELASGVLRDLGALPGLVERFYAITFPRQFPNPLVAELIARASNEAERPAGRRGRRSGVARGGGRRYP